MVHRKTWIVHRDTWTVAASAVTENHFEQNLTSWADKKTRISQTTGDGLDIILVLPHDARSRLEQNRVDR